MLASVIIEYSAKSLNRVFDYIIPDELINTLKVGHKVIVPFASKEVEFIRGGSYKGGKATWLEAKVTTDYEILGDKKRLKKSVWRLSNRKSTF